MAYKEPDPVSESEVAAGLNKDLEVTNDRPTRQEAAIGLKVQGANYTEIAEVLGYSSANQARLAVERGLASLVGKEDREQLRFIEARRLERILRSVWKKATNEKSPEHLAAARTALGIIDRHARLYGLDAPQELVVYNPTNTELNAWVTRMAQQVRGSGPMEVDIIDGEVLEREDSDG